MLWPNLTNTFDDLVTPLTGALLELYARVTEALRLREVINFGL